MSIKATNKTLSFAAELAKYIIKKRGIGLSRIEKIPNEERKANILAFHKKAFPKTAFQKSADCFFAEARELMSVALKLATLLIALGSLWTLPMAASVFITALFLTEIVISMLELSHLLWTAHLENQQIATLESKGIIHFNNDEPLLLDALHQRHNVSPTTDTCLNTQKTQNNHIKTLAHARDIAVSILDTNGDIATFMKDEVLVKIALGENIEANTLPELLKTQQGDNIGPSLILPLYEEHTEIALTMIHNLNTIFDFDQSTILSVIESDAECHKAFQRLKEARTDLDMEISTFKSLSASITQLRLKLQDPSKRVSFPYQIAQNVTHTLSQAPSTIRNGVQSLGSNLHHFFTQMGEAMAQHGTAHNIR